MCKSGIYAILNLLNGKRYVGQSTNLLRRKVRHIGALKGGRHVNKHLQAAYDKYGKESFEFQVLEEVSVDMLDVRERDWILHYASDKSGLGYNQTTGGCVDHKPLTDSMREQRRDAGRRSARMRPVRSPESVARQAASLRGFKHSDETKAKMSLANRGKTLSDEHRAKIRASLVGHKISDKARAALGATNYPGKKLSDQHRARISVAMRLRREKKTNMAA